ncbi:ABC transporter ATP-binding protein [Candidatus Kaiserbacteria bacterium]|nr:ABC transporter ATP-binding protein [Candidatus Kaiserbacteria bacterium]
MAGIMSSKVRPEGDDRDLPKPYSPRGALRILKVLGKTFHGYRRYMVLLAGLAVLSAALDGIGINAVIPLVSFVMGGQSGPLDTITQLMARLFGLVGVPFTFRYLLVFIMLIFLARSVVLTAFTYVRSWISARFMAREIDSLFRSTMHASWPYILRQKSGDLQNTIFWDARRETQLLDGIVQFLQSTTGAFMYLLVAINISPLITWATVAVGTIVIVFFRPLLRRTHAHSQVVATTEKLLSHHISESIQGFKQVKASGAGDSIANKGSEYIGRLEHALAKTYFNQGIGSVYIQPLALIFVIGIFAFSYFSGTFQVASFAATVYLIQKIFNYISSTQASFQSILQFIPFADNIAAFKKEVARNHEAASKGTNPFVFEDGLSFDHVTFGYEGKSNQLEDVSFDIKKGSFVGIIGPSGSGKTTVADLILRLFAPTHGEIRVDGVSTSEVSIKEWRAAIAYVSQDAFIMNASVLDNIRFFDESISREDIELAAQLAHIHDDIMRLPQGFDTVLGDRGVTISGGQRQRISLARALARKPQVLVLDEVTSSLDSELERDIQQMIANLRGGITLVVIAHRISTILDADKIVVIDSGHLAEEGAPAQMLENPDSYLARIATLQKTSV